MNGGPAHADPEAISTKSATSPAAPKETRRMSANRRVNLLAQGDHPRFPGLAHRHRHL